MGKFGNKCRIIILLILTGGFFFVELTVGYFTNSMALVADSFHMLSDEIALLVAYVSVRMSPKEWKQNTYGWARAEVLGALANAVFLVALCFTISVEAVERFMEVRHIKNPKLLLVVGSIGLVINIIGLFLFHDYSGFHNHSGSLTSKSENTCLKKNDKNGTAKDKVTNSNIEMQNLNHIEDSDDGIDTDIDVYRVDSSSLKTRVKDMYSNSSKCKRHKHSHTDPGQMNMRGVFLHVLSDALGSVIVIISALIYWLTDWKYKYYIDPALSIILVLLILHSAWPLLRDSALILLQTVPAHIQVDDIKGRLLSNVDGVLGVHEFHIWQLAGERIIASAHIRVKNLFDYMKVAEEVKEFFHNEGIHSTTIQPEFVGSADFLRSLDDMNQTNDCILVCPPTPSNSCIQYTCCGPFREAEDHEEPQNA